MIKFKPPKIKMSTNQLRSILFGIAAYAYLRTPQVISGSGGGTPGGGGGGGTTPWKPKWHIGDILLSRTLPDARWVVKGHDLPARQYFVDFTWAGATQVNMRVDAANLEDPNIYY